MFSTHRAFFIFGQNENFGLQKKNYFRVQRMILRNPCEIGTLHPHREPKPKKTQKYLFLWFAHLLFNLWEIKT